MIRVLLVDDHVLVRMGFRMLLSQAGVEVVGEADQGEAALPLAARLNPDVVVMDLSMPGMGGIECLKRLLLQDPRTRVLVLSAHEDTAHPRRALKGGAMGYLAKRSAPEELIEAVRTVAQGKRYVDARTAQALATQAAESDASPAELLSEKEFSVFLQLARGHSAAQIAADMKLSPSTVGTHLYHVKQKLGAANQSELTLLALRWGYLQG